MAPSSQVSFGCGVCRRSTATSWRSTKIPVRLNTPHAPVLIVHGEWNPIVPVAQAYRYRQTHPTTEIDVVPGAGHFSVIDPLGPAWTTVRNRLLTVT
jgi:pimeloyl-ACP methyl ester carboxylesterase